MATGAEKEARQAARDAARASIVQGRARLAAEQPRAAGAFPVRRLRSAGDLSRYAIGGFLDDPFAAAGAAAGKGAAAQVRGRGVAKAAVKGAIGRPAPVVRALPARGVRTSGLIDAREAAYVNRAVGIRPTSASRTTSYRPRRQG